jgi:hypothetical protein
MLTRPVRVLELPRILAERALWNDAPAIPRAPVE